MQDEVAQRVSLEKGLLQLLKQSNNEMVIKDRKNVISQLKHNAKAQTQCLSEQLHAPLSYWKLPSVEGRSQ